MPRSFKHLLGAVLGLSLAACATAGASPRTDSRLAELERLKQERGWTFDLKYTNVLTSKGAVDAAVEPYLGQKSPECMPASGKMRALTSGYVSDDEVIPSTPAIKEALCRYGSSRVLMHRLPVTLRA